MPSFIVYNRTHKLCVYITHVVQLLGHQPSLLALKLPAHPPHPLCKKSFNFTVVSMVKGSGIRKIVNMTSISYNSKSMSNNECLVVIGRFVLLIDLVLMFKQEISIHK